MSPSPAGNHLLLSLSQSDFALLQPDLEPITLALRETVEYPYEPIAFIYFPTSGMLSVVAVAGEDRIEVGIIGRDGMSGCFAVLGGETSPHLCFVQVALEGFRIRTSALKAAMAASATLHARCLLYVSDMLRQAGQTALANGRGTIEERLARWILVSQDKLETDELPLTHEFLAIMLGVRRPGVTVALDLLERAKVTTNRRGRITILDRPGLEEIAGSIYNGRGHD